METIKLKEKPDSDFYPSYSDDYYRDMDRWKSENKSCRYPHCVCVGNECHAVKFGSKKMTLIFPDVMF